MRGSAQEAERRLSAPDTRVISLDYDPETLRLQVIGGSGAVPDSAMLLVGNLELNDYTILRADAHGAFETEVIGVPGTHVLIKQDTTSRYIRPDIQQFDSIGDLIAPGVLMRVPVEPTINGIPFGAGARVCCEENKNAPWTIVGAFERDALIPGDSFKILGQTSLLTGPSNKPPTVSLNFYASLLGDVDGRQVGRALKFVTPFLTATDLPIEPTLRDLPRGGFVDLGSVDLDWEFDGTYWSSRIDTTLQAPRGVRPGVYALTAGELSELGDLGLGPAGLRQLKIPVNSSAFYLATLGTVTIGNPEPMRLATTLLADQVSEGSRGGVLAREDQGVFDISPRAVTRHDPVIPRLDGYGQPWTYRLEPYLPMLDAGDSNISTPPAIPLDLVASELTIIVRGPDGVTEVLGPAPLTRYAVKSPSTPWGDTLGAGGGELREMPQLLGDGNTFAYRFPVDGEYIITLDGHVDDLGGRTYEICGTYDVTVANVLDIETALLPTTPLEVGNSIPVTVTIVPGYPAQVRYSVLHVAADGQVSDVSNQQKWDTLGAERSGAGWRSGELPEGPVVASSPFGGLSLHLLPAL